MRAIQAVVGIVLVAAALSVIPSAQAGLPIVCVMAPCGPEGPLVSGPHCPPTDRQDGGVHTVVSWDCTAQIDIKLYDCVWNCGWHTVVQGPPLTVRVYEQNSPPTESSSVQMPPPCQYCDPHCPPVAISTSEFFAWAGPHAGVELTSGCHANAWEHGLRCETAGLPLTGSQTNEQVYLVGASVDSCTIGFICACMPASASAAQVPPPCSTCVCASFAVETFEARLTWTSSCRLVVTVHDNLYNCIEPKTITAGAVTVQPEACQPICACMPANMGAAPRVALR